MVLPSVVEETEESVQIHVGRTFQEVLLQRVLESVDSFIRILQCSVQNTWSSIRAITNSNLSLIPNSFGHDNSYLLQLMFEVHKKLQTSKLEFGLNSKAFLTGYSSLT